MGLFERKQYLTRGELREALRKTYDPKIKREERVKIEKEIFGRQRYGEDIKKEEYQRALRELSGARVRAKTGAERIDIERRINLLKKLGGV